VGTRFEDFTPAFFVFSSFALLLIALAVRSYVLSSKKHRRSSKRGSWVAAMVSGLLALFGTAIYGVSALGDFLTPGIRLRDALIGNLIVWGVCLGAWVIAVRCVIFALRRNGQQ